MPNCAIYARVSTTDQDCKVQLAELREYAKGRGWAVVGEYVDTGYSGGKASRPKLDKCRADALRRRFDTILVYRLDRWGRSVSQLSADLLALDSAGIRFICPAQGIDTDQSNAMSRLLINVLSAFAQFERDIINERVVAGVRHAQKHGTKSGLPFGRPRAIFDRGKVRELRSSGLGIRGIAAKLGISHGSVQRALEEAE
jgi:DNA invertase Pin-like site-specific DNA recombinase